LGAAQISRCNFCASEVLFTLSSGHCVWKFAFGYVDVYVQPASFFSVIILLFFIVEISNSSSLGTVGALKFY
jgi:hypothetical protein